MRKSLARNSDGRILFGTGSTGCGKTTWAFREVPREAELLVWDAKLEWSGKFKRCVAIHSLRDLHEWVTTGAVRGARFTSAAYVGPMSRDHFITFCKLAWVWLRIKKRRWLVVEELADVTNPGKAPAAWGEILRKSRDPWQSNVIALTQRPAESDSTIAGNCAVIHSGFQSFPRDRKTISEYLDVPLAQVVALASCEYIERNMRTRELRTGVLKF